MGTGAGRGGGAGGVSAAAQACRRGRLRTVNLGVPRIPQRVEAARPGRDPPARGEHDEDREADRECGHDECAEEQLELLARDELAHRLDKRDELEEAEHACGARERVSTAWLPETGAAERTECGHVLARPDREEADKGHLHGRERADDVPRRVGEVELVVEPAHQNKDERVQGDHWEPGVPSAAPPHILARPARPGTYYW